MPETSPLCSPGARVPQQPGHTVRLLWVSCLRPSSLSRPSLISAEPRFACGLPGVELISLPQFVSIRPLSAFVSLLLASWELGQPAPWPWSCLPFQRQLPTCFLGSFQVFPVPSRWRADLSVVMGTNDHTLFRAHGEAFMGKLWAWLRLQRRQLACRGEQGRVHLHPQLQEPKKLVNHEV